MINNFDEIIKKIKNENDIFIKAKLVRDLIKEKEIKVKDVSEKLGLKPAYICHLQRLNNLPDIIVDGYYSKQISLTHLFIISRLKDKSQMISLYEKVLTNNLSVYQTENLVREILYGIKHTGQRISKKEKEEFIKKITEGEADIKIDIIQTRIKGKIILEIKGNLTKTTKVLKRFLERLSDAKK